MLKKILVVDDDQGILDAFTAILESSGYQVITEADSNNLSKTISKNKPDLIILDVLLSGGDGREICKNLKSDPKTKNIPIIIASAHPSARKAVEESGADDFLEKPFDMEELFKKVKKQLNKS